MAMHSVKSTADAALGSNDPDSFRLFVDHYQQSIFGFLGRMGFVQSEAEDLAQEVFLKAWRYRASYDPAKASASTWLFSIARNTALSRIKSQLRQVPIDSTDIADVSDTHHNQPEQQLTSAQQRETILRALQKLSAEDRCAIALYYLDDLSNAQAAAIIGCSEGAFRTRLSRARTRLKAIVSTETKIYE